ncbi:hypothetical protein KVV02_008418 [Mortierella alpina]|uniref:Uncharacterized protein n=1 Tax=Mortierella alpina TaxID=64518 RepID=A0A9P8D0R1_MORAP|nr:hypothetical protein KVV02_008418 [Mortierella alpina]
MSSSSSSHRSTNLVNRMSSLMAVAGVAGLAILGVSLAPSADAAISFGAAVDSPGSIILGGLSSMVPKPVSMMDKYLVPGLMNFTYVSLAVPTSRQVVVGINASLMNPLGAMALPLGRVGVDIHLDDMLLAKVTMADLTLPAGIGPLNVTATIDIADGNTTPLLKASINRLVTGFIGGITPTGPPSKLVLDNVTISGNPLGLEPITIPTQPRPSAPLVEAPGGSTVPPVFGLSGLFNPAVNLTWPTINKVTAKALTGAQLSAGLGFTWNNPLNIGLDVPYFSLDIGLNGTRVFTLGVKDLYLAPGNMTAEPSVDLKFNNEPEAAHQVGAFVSDFLAGTINHVVNIGNITFGAPENMTGTAVVLNTLLGDLSLNLPLMNVSTIAIQDLVLGFIKPYFPIDIGKLGSGVGPSLSNYIKSLAISTAAGHTLLISPQIQLPLPFAVDLNVPYFALDINLDNNMLGQLFLADLVASGSGQVDVSVGIGIVFTEPSPEIPHKIGEIVNAFTTGSSLGISAGVSNIAIGLSPADAVNTLNLVNVALPISSVVTGSLNTGSLISDLWAQTNITIAPNVINVKVGSLLGLSIHEAAIAVLPNNMITLGVNLDMFLGMPIIANIGYLGLKFSLDDANLAGVDLNTGLNYGGGYVQMNAGVAISVGTGPEISRKVADLVNAVIANQPVTAALGISGIVLGASSSDTINALSEIALSLPLGGFLGGNAPALPTGFLERLLAQLGLSLTELSLATIPGAGLQVGAKAAFSNPIPISLSVPYIGGSGGLDHIDILNLGLDNLALIPGSNALQAKVNLNFNNGQDAQAIVAKFVGELFGGQFGNTPEAITVHDIRFGASPTDYFDILSQIDVSIPSKDIINKPVVDFIMAKLGLNLDQLANGLLGNLMNNVGISAISADLNKAPVIDLGASVTVRNFSLNAAVNIGYFGIDLALDSHSLAHVDVPSITIVTANNELTLSFKASATVYESAEIQTDVANLVNYFLANSTVSPVQTLVLSKPLLGASISDNIQTFSQIQLPIGMPPLLTLAKNYLNQFLGGDGGIMSKLVISGLVIDVNSPSVIRVQGGIMINEFSLPADIKLNYVGASLGLDATPLADLSVPSLTLASSNNALSINFDALLDVKQSKDLNGQIARLVGAVLSPGQVTPPTNAVVYNPVFGGDKDHLFKIISQVKVNIALAPILQVASALLNAFRMAPGGMLSMLDFRSLAVDLNSPQTIGIDAALAIKYLALPVELKLNYVGINLALETADLAKVAIPKFTLQPDNGQLAITAHIDAAVQTSTQLTSALTGLINGVLNNQTSGPVNVVFSGAVFGGSANNVFTILQDIVVPINIAPIIKMIGGSGSLLNGIGLSGLGFNLNQAPTIGIDGSVAIRNFTLPMQLNVGYFGLDIAINDVPLVGADVTKIQFGANGGDFTVGAHIDANLKETDASQTLIAGFVNAIVAGQVPQGTIMISGVAFGASKGNVFTILRDVKIPIDIAKILAILLPNVPTLPGTGAGSILDKLALENLDINFKNPPRVGADIGIALLGYVFDAQLQLNYVGINAFLDETPLAKIAVPGIGLVSGNNQIALKINALVELLSGDAVQTKVAAIVNQIIGGGVPQNVNLVVSNIAFGGSESNTFHILDKVRVSVALAPIIQKLVGIISGGGGGGGGNSTLPSIPFSITKLDIGAAGADELSVAVGASVGGIGSKVSVDLPYGGLQVAAAGNGFIAPTLNNFQLSNGNIALSLSLPFLPAAKSIVGSLSAPISQLLFTTVGTVPGSVVANNIKFGASAGQAFDILGKVSIELQLNAIFQKAQAYINAHNPLHINDLNTVLTPSGIQASLTVPGIPLTVPFKLNFPISLSGYYKGQAFMAIHATSMSLGQSPWAMGTTINPIMPEFKTAINGILPQALQWKNVLLDVTLGGVTLGSFTTFQGLIISPPEVTLWSPIKVDQFKLHLVPLGMDFTASFVNRGPMQVDVGSVDVMIKQGSTDVIEIQNLGGPIHLYNGNQNGGNNAIPLNGSLKFNFLEFFKIIFALLNPADNFQFVFSMKTSSGQPMPWLQDALNDVPAVIFKNLLPILGKALQNIQFGLGGSDPSLPAPSPTSAPTSAPSLAPTAAVPAPTSVPPPGTNGTIF